MELGPFNHFDRPLIKEYWPIDISENGSKNVNAGDRDNINTSNASK